jgi:hypothetical protein
VNALDGDSADRIQQVYLTNRFRDPEDTLKLVPAQADRDPYRFVVLDREVPEDDSLMAGAYEFFKRQLANGIDNNVDLVIPAKVLTTIAHCLQLVMINLGDADDPYLIFESLNFKGEPLTQADLVRNYLLMRFRHSMSAGGEQERVHSQYWRPMEEGHGMEPRLLDHPLIIAIAQRVRKTPAQVLLAWAVQRGTGFLTTSVIPARIQENFELSTLPEDAMQEIRDGVATRIRFNVVVETGVPGFIPRGR